MDVFEVKAIGHGRGVPEDDNWDASSAEIELDPNQFNAEASLIPEQFSQAEIVFVFDQIGPEDITQDARHPRGGTDWPKVGIFAQRGRNRPNRLGVSVAGLLKFLGSFCVFKVWMRSMGRPFWISSP
jgi:tRNA (Thr-GGU) A37 N-methylase